MRSPFMDHDPVSVVLDLVQPQGTARRVPERVGWVHRDDKTRWAHALAGEKAVVSLDGEIKT